MLGKSLTFIQRMSGLTPDIQKGVTVRMDDSTINAIVDWITRSGKKTSEYITTLAAIVIGIVKAKWIPDLPNEVFYVLITYIVSRFFTKNSISDSIKMIKGKE